MSELPIGQLARETGVKIATIRYYESIGMMPEPLRSVSNRRLYDRQAVKRLCFIRHARELGFEIEAIMALLELQAGPEMSCASVDAIARSHLIDVDRRIKSLQALKREFERMIRNCRKGRVADCNILEVLQDHARCQHHHKNS